MEKLRKLFGIHKEKEIPVSAEDLKANEQKNLKERYEKTLLAGFKLLDDLQVKDKLVEACTQLFGQNDNYIIENNLVSLEEYKPYENYLSTYTIKSESNPDIVLLGITVTVGQDPAFLSDHICIFGKTRQNQDFKKSTLLFSSDKKYSKVSGNRETKNWLEEKIKNYLAA